MRTQWRHTQPAMALRRLITSLLARWFCELRLAVIVFCGTMNALASGNVALSLLLAFDELLSPGLLAAACVPSICTALLQSVPHCSMSSCAIYALLLRTYSAQAAL